MAEYKRKCLYCGAEFTASRRDKKYCSDSHRASYHQQTRSESESPTLSAQNGNRNGYVTREEFTELKETVQALAEGQQKLVEKLDFFLEVLLANGLPNQMPTIQPTPRSDVPLPDIEIKAATADQDNRSDWNFLISTALLMGNINTLPPEVVAYGERTGKIHAQA